MSTIKTCEELAESAQNIVIATLAYSREFMEQLTYLQLPAMLADGKVVGWAKDNSAVFTEYGPDWTGLAVSSHSGTRNYWFMYRCEKFDERAICCLGPQESVGAAIDAAIKRVTADLYHWQDFSQVA